MLHPSSELIKVKRLQHFGAFRRAISKKEGCVFLSSQEQTKLLKIIESLHHSLDSQELREKAGELILDLLEADYFASFVWNSQSESFDKAVILNMDMANIDNYNKHYYKVDPIASILKSSKEATVFSQIMPPHELERTEFYNDFLSVDGLHYGISLHVYNNENHIGDIRVWRNKKREDFDARSLYLLDLIKPHFRNAMRNAINYESKAKLVYETDYLRTDIAYIAKKFKLTKREMQVVEEVLKGKKDGDIACSLCIAFSTLRTHIKNIFSKLKVNNRAALIRKVYSV